MTAAVEGQGKAAGTHSSAIPASNNSRTLLFIQGVRLLSFSAFTKQRSFRFRICMQQNKRFGGKNDTGARTHQIRRSCY